MAHSVCAETEHKQYKPKQKTDQSPPTHVVNVRMASHPHEKQVLEDDGVLSPLADAAPNAVENHPHSRYILENRPGLTACLC